MDDLFEESERLVFELLQLVDLPTIDSQQAQISDTACSLALEHWHAVRSLLQLGLVPSALVVHAAQFGVGEGATPRIEALQRHEAS
jgi:hypothetical protein